MKRAIFAAAIRGLLGLGVGGVIVAISLTPTACNRTDNGQRSSGTSTPPTASTTVVSKTPGSPPAPGTYPSEPIGGDQASAETAIKQGYVQKLADCYATRNAVANVVAINWDPPGFSQNRGGSGVIRDSDPGLGGQFSATYEDGRWKIVYNWC